jgi:hypothetical protein
MLYHLAGLETRWARAADLVMLALFMLLMASYLNVLDINLAFAGVIGRAPQAITNLLFNLFAACFLSALFITTCKIMSADPNQARNSARDSGGYYGLDAGVGSTHGAACGDGASCGGDGGGGGGE